ncbi:TolC family protein [Deinococcus sp.]|uniref:TolC family protein n=1 Tax=Deinococcus sp. TaxID=47478 RepID=UPI003CC65DA3
MKTLALTLALLISGALAQTTTAPTPLPTTPPTPLQAPPATQPPPATPPVSPDPAVPADPFTLAQALSGLTQAPGWRSAALQYLSAQQSLDAARARTGLSLSAGGTVTPVLAPLDGGSWNVSTALSAQASLNVLPWSSAQESVRQASRAVQRAGLDQRDAQNVLALNAVQQYLSVRQNEAALTLAQGQLQLAARSLEVARAQVQSGTLTQEGLLDKQAAQQQAQAGLDDARSALDSAVRQLYNTLGTPAPDPADWHFVGVAPLPAAPAPLETLLARAAQSRSEVFKARSALEDAQAGLEIAQLNRTLPSLSVSAQYGQLGSSTSSSTTSSGSTVSSSLDLKAGTLSASVSVPLTSSKLPTSLALSLSGSFAVFDPSADASVRSAQTAVASAQLALQTAQTSVELDVRQKYAQLQNALSGLGAPRTSLLRAQTALSSTQARLSAGLSTALDVESAQLSVQQAQTTLKTSVNSAYLASLTLSQAVGEFSPALVQLAADPLARSAVPAPAAPSAESDALPGGQP